MNLKGYCNDNLTTFSSDIIGQDSNVYKSINLCSFLVNAKGQLYWDAD